MPPARTALLLLLLLALAACAAAPARGPLARRAPAEVTTHGHSRADPLLWLRRGPTPEALALLRAERDFALATLAPTEALQREIHQEILARIPDADASLPVRLGDHLYFRRASPGQPHPLYLRRPLADGPDALLLDPNPRAEGHPAYRVASLTVSPEGHTLAFAEDANGDDRYTARFRDLSTGALLPDALPDTSGNLAWLDPQTLLYVRLHPTTGRADEVRRHTLGTNPDADPLVLRQEDPRASLWLRRSRSGAYIFLESDSHTTSAIHLLPTGAPDAQPRLLLPPVEGRRASLTHAAHTFTLLLHPRGAPDRLLRLHPDRPADLAAAAPVPLPDGLDALTRVVPFEHHLAILARHGGLPRLFILDPDGHTRPVPFDAAAYTLDLNNNRTPDADHLRVFFSAPHAPDAVYAVDLDSGDRRLLKQSPAPTVDPAAYTTRRTAAPADDGTPIPITLVHRKDLDPTGPHPLLLRVYGAYGVPWDPRFSRALLSLLDRGVVAAVAHVRGGGELGRPWHEAARLTHKPTSVADLLACAQHLVDLGLTAPDRLALSGGSAGGALVGAALNARPELFAAALADVPFVDPLATLLDPDAPLTAGDTLEWGDPRAHPDHYRALLAWSPYDNVRPAPYPAVLATAGLHDTHVRWWEPARWVQRLRQHTTSGHPVLLLTDMDGGHQGASGAGDRYRAVARKWAFLLTRMEGTR